MKPNSTWYANSQRIKILMMSIISGHESKRYAKTHAIFDIHLGAHRRVNHRQSISLGSSPSL